MKLIIGGYAQGKLNYVLQNNALEPCTVLDGEIPDELKVQGKRLILNHFHEWVRSRLEQGQNPEMEIVLFLERYPDSIIICDEIGNGIVPVEAFERAYREHTGRILIKLADRADEVVRIICGIGQKIK